VACARAFKLIKHRLRLEAAMVLTHLTFQQDFAAKIVADYPHTLLVIVHDEITTEVDVTAINQPHFTYALGALKPILARSLQGLHSYRGKLSDALDAIESIRCRM
jgi:hypothetical protein